MSIFNDVDGSVGVSKVGKLQGADFMFWGDTAIEGPVMENMLRSLFTVTERTQSGTGLVTSHFSPAYGVHYFSAVTDFSLLSCELPVPSEGMRLRIDCQNNLTDANLQVEATAGGASIDGITLIRPSGSALSGLNISALGYAELMCFTDGTWTVIEDNPSCTQNVI